MDWTNKLIKHSFPEIQMVPNKEGIYKKKFIKVGKNWSGLTESNVNPDHKAIAVLTGIKSGIIVIDFDDKNLYKCTIEEFPELELAPRVATRNGYHLYFRWKNEYQTDLPAKIEKIDVLKNGKQALFPGTTYKTETNETFAYTWENQGELIDLPSDFISKIKIENENKNENESSPASSVPKKYAQSASGYAAYAHKCIYLNLIAIIKVKFLD